MTTTITLKKPITTHDGEVATLTLRDPTGGDYVDLAELPFIVRGDGPDRAVIPNFKLCMAWLERLSGVDRILLRQLTSADFMRTINALGEHMNSEGDTPGNSPA